MKMLFVPFLGRILWQHFSVQKTLKCSKTGRYAVTIGGHNGSCFMASVEIFDVCSLRRFSGDVWSINKARSFHSCDVIDDFKTTKFGPVEA